MRRIAMLGLGLCLWAAPVQAAPDFFPLRVGDWWKYKVQSGGKTTDFTIKVVKQQGDRVLVETTSSQVIQDWYSHPAGWVLQHQTIYPASKLKADLKPARKLLKNPLVPGEKWDYKGTGMMGVSLEEHNRVGPAREVKVAAGTFQAVHLDTQVTQAGAKVVKSYDYADGIGLVRSHTESGGVKSDCELVDYSFKKR
ncbi:MAG: hypothetical protein U0931_24990 [Vulcanimicrobiota bacterium]